MARTSWFDESAQQPLVQEQVDRLDSFTSAMADGLVSKRELEEQEKRLVAGMKDLEPELNDDLHRRVTTVLVELTAYNIMRLLHELRVERVRKAFGSTD